MRRSGVCIRKQIGLGLKHDLCQHLIIQILHTLNALMNLHENYSNVQKIADLAKRKEDLENQKNDLELQWIEKSDEYEREFSSESI